MSKWERFAQEVAEELGRKLCDDIESAEAVKDCRKSVLAAVRIELQIRVGEGRHIPSKKQFVRELYADFTGCDSKPSDAIIEYMRTFLLKD